MNRQQAQLKQIARQNDPEHTRATYEVRYDMCRPLTGLRYRYRLRDILCGKEHKFENQDDLVYD